MNKLNWSFHHHLQLAGQMAILKLLPYKMVKILHEPTPSCTRPTPKRLEQCKRRNTPLLEVSRLRTAKTRKARVQSERERDPCVRTGFQKLGRKHYLDTDKGVPILRVCLNDWYGNNY